ncbi:polynucleotide kinase-phosphatase [Paenibacillus baekrokdamisoli]|uniref:Polynucleotide kinase-phosphatase n=1 Tax=Paenibacillus baekrokdamisoli TaxID=1712516 RepID=A0A3G9JGY6_9BACL|nr:metallophosphoesterase [Paenibacillus baekrokdamisoli]MBB3070789.1 putative kinase [Paenibacillus baekrokdamisoli]BBH22269.1 polynucleotide kinase-phosphatase [Paenibacillus baekrokdamisoli]
MEIQTKVHTIFLMIGSTECGKTTFAKEVLMPQLKFADESKNSKSNVQYISSDSIRQEILGFDYDKYDNVMLEASSQAFHLLFERLKVSTSFPINAEFVIVDTTGLAEDFRGKIRDIAYENNYNVEVILFDYRNREDYYASDRSKKLITNHLNRLKKDVLGSLSREGYSKIHKIRAKDFYSVTEQQANPDYKVVVEDLDAYCATILPNNQKYIIIGDVHECIHELQGLLLDYGYKIEGNKLVVESNLQDTKLILAGDWIDKGKHTKAIVEFLYENQEHFLFVLGNHENFVDKFIRGEIKGVDEEFLHTYFDSTQALLKDWELLEKFQALVAKSKPFFRLNGAQGPSFYVTHAPCMNKYLGKLDSNSIRHQRNYRVNRNAPLQEQLDFLREEAVGNHPYHVFGHIAAKQAFRIKNKLHIDSGSVHGNMLTAVSISFKPFFKSHKSKQAELTEELPVLFQEARKVSIQDLDNQEIRRLHYCSRNKINFISGTMSPANKDEAAGELESLRRGLDYFVQQGQQEVVLQPKYMGSRCNIYLHKDVTQSYGVSRNGYKISQVDLSGIYAQLLKKFGDYMESHAIEMLILDGELLPWKALGDGLIQKQFKPIEKALETELEFLQHSGFEQAYSKLTLAYEASGFEKDQYHISKSELSDKYGSSVYQNYKYVREVGKTNVPLSDHVKAYQTYKKQLELYALDAELAYQPFAILKIVYENGEEQIPDWTTSRMYRFVSEEECLVVNLSDPDCYEQAELYFSKLTVANHMEGVVIKPEVVREGSVPHMKVRNADYLSIVYGYDYRFPHKYNKLMKQKNISSKLRTSASEHQLGNKLLSIKLSEINPDNDVFKGAVANLLFEVSKEKEIDPRL